MIDRDENLEAIDRLVSELAQIDRRLDGRKNRDTGEVEPGELDLLAEAEDEWMIHRDAMIAELVEGEYKGRQLPGNDRIDALTRSASLEAREAFRAFRHHERITKRLRERAERLTAQVSGRQTMAKRPEVQTSEPARPVTIPGQRRAA